MEEQEAEDGVQYGLLHRATAQSCEVGWHIVTSMTKTRPEHGIICYVWQAMTCYMDQAPGSDK